MDDLFGGSEAESTGRTVSANAPLAARFRPRVLEEYIGQSHLLAPGKPLRRLIEADRLQSLILFGPPGVGKTSLAEVIARRTEAHFERLNGVEGTVADLRRVLGAAVTRMKASGKRTVLFIDEIHRFNKAQQDVLLPDVEAGSVRLIGATTHNPSFYVNGPLVSRSQIFQLEPLTSADLSTLIDAALADPERGLGKLKIELASDARKHLIAVAEGDARRALNGLEIAALTTPADAKGVVRIDAATIEECVQKKRVLYDKDEDQHYDTISAFIKSVRGSDPDSALYWLAKMIEAGEDPRFIARRLIILASEDIGLADPMGIIVAVSAMQAVEFMGMPEGQITLANATLYLACAAKSNSSVIGIGEARAAVQKGELVEVPKHLRDAHYAGAERLGHGKGYQYSHDYAGGIAPQRYGVEAGRFFHPTDFGYEAKIKARLAEWEKLRATGPKK
ncbi:MAG TPA: replication-associated recombination protein A [Candidatus Methylacidiphilales bacterium]|jgi:putative ATPase|nr:replication-associated recombination protein A [Candidatus Methylacidiphilales bacterium]